MKMLVGSSILGGRLLGIPRLAIASKPAQIKLAGLPRSRGSPSRPRPLNEHRYKNLRRVFTRASALEEETEPDWSSWNEGEDEDMTEELLEYIALLNQEYGLPDVIQFMPGEGLMPRVWIKHPHSGMGFEIYLHGAAITQWLRPDMSPALTSPSKVDFDWERPIKGGLRMAFPAYRENNIMSEDGFAGRMTWEVVAAGFGCLPLDDGMRTKERADKAIELVENAIEYEEKGFVMPKDPDEARKVKATMDFFKPDLKRIREVEDEVLAHRESMYELALQRDYYERVHANRGEDGELKKGDADEVANKEAGGKPAESENGEEVKGEDTTKKKKSTRGRGKAKAEAGAENDSVAEGHVDDDVKRQTEELKGAVDRGSRGEDGEGSEAEAGAQVEEPKTQAEEGPRGESRMKDAGTAAAGEKSSTEPDDAQGDASGEGGEEEPEKVEVTEDQFYNAIAMRVIEERLGRGEDPAPYITLKLTDGPETHDIWPHRFEMLHKITVMEKDTDPGLEQDEAPKTQIERIEETEQKLDDGVYRPPPSGGRQDPVTLQDIPVQLKIETILRNLDRPSENRPPMEFEIAQLANFATRDITNIMNSVKILGLGGAQVFDYTMDERMPLISTNRAHFLKFDGHPIDTTFIKAADADVKLTPGDGTHFEVIPRRGYQDVMVYHPGIDSPESDYCKMLGIGVGNVSTSKRLAAGESWEGELVLRWHNNYWERPSFEEEEQPFPPMRRQDFNVEGTDREVLSDIQDDADGDEN